jgi:hypothetical protein
LDWNCALVQVMRGQVNRNRGDDHDMLNMSHRAPRARAHKGKGGADTRRTTWMDIRTHTGPCSHGRSHAGQPTHAAIRDETRRYAHAVPHHNGWDPQSRVHIDAPRNPYTLMSATAYKYTHTHNCETNGHNSGSESQIPRQLDHQTRQSMSDANRRLSAAQVMGRDGYASWGMHRDLHEAKGGLWQHRWTRSLHRTQQNVKTHLGTRATHTPTPPIRTAKTRTEQEKR